MAERTATGQFLPGHRRVGGRKPNQVKQAYLEAMVERWTPDETLDDLDWCVTYGKEKGWPKVVLMATELKLFMLYGKPQQSVSVNSSGLQEVLDMLSSKVD